MRHFKTRVSWAAYLCVLLCFQQHALGESARDVQGETVIAGGRVLAAPIGAAGTTVAKPKSPWGKPKSPPAKPKSPVFTPKSPVFKPKSPVFKPKSPVFKPKSPVFKPKSPVFKPKSPVLKPKSPVFKPKSPVFKPKSPVFKPKSPVFKPKSPVFKPKSPVVSPKSPVVSPKSPVAVKPKSPIVKPSPPKPSPPATDPFKSRIPSPMVINGPYFFWPNGTTKIVSGPFPIKPPVYTGACNGVTRKGAFIKGANIPYAYKTAIGNTYGINFGNSYKRSLEGKNYQPAFWQEAYGNLQETKSTLARIYVFADGRSSELWAKDTMGNWRVADGVSENFMKHFKSMLDIAHKAGVQVNPTLITYKIMQYREDPTWPATAPIRRGFLVTDHNQTDIFMEKIFKPIVQRFANHPAVHSWDCVNEPEQVMMPDPGSKSSTMFFKAKHADWAHWIAKCASVIHQNSKQLATFGTWDVRYLCTKPELGCFGSFWHDDALQKLGLPNNPELWPYAYLDFYAPHFYKQPSYLVGRPACAWGADKPILIGETPNRGMWGPDYNPDKVLEYACKNGYMGLLFFSMYASQDDPSRHWSEFEPVLRQFDANTCTNSFPQEPWQPWPSPPLPSPVMPRLVTNVTTPSNITVTPVVNTTVTPVVG